MSDYSSTPVPVDALCGAAYHSRSYFRPAPPARFCAPACRRTISWPTKTPSELTPEQRETQAAAQAALAARYGYDSSVAQILDHWRVQLAGSSAGPDW